MILLIIAIILALAGVGWFLFAVEAKALGVIPLVIAAALLIWSCSTVVEAKNVGVVTTFGKPTGTMDPGFNLKKPWDKVTDIDGTVQTRTYDTDNPLYVRIGDGSRSAVSLALRWQIVPDEADTIYADYRADDPTAEVGDKLVSPQLKAALQKTLGDYNPVATLKVVKAEDTGEAAPSFAPDFDAISEQLLSDLQGRSELVEILDVSVTYVSISDNTQKALDDFTKAVGQTVAAQQNKETSAAQAEANRELEGATSPAINQARCLDALNAAIENGYSLPAGFNCLGAGSSVVVPSAR